VDFAVPVLNNTQKFSTSATPNTGVVRGANADVTNGPETCTQLTCTGPVTLKWNAQTSSYAMSASAGGDCIVYMDATGGARNVTLPPPSTLGAGQKVIVIKKDGSANNVTVLPNASETINGAASKVLSAQYSVCTLWNDGTNWIASTTTS
jgi:hypothetical protein